MAAQVLPGAQSHFGPFPSMFNTHMFSEYQSYANMQTESFAGSHSGLRSNQGYFVSPRSTASGETHRRPSVQSPTPVMRQAPSRNRTPIQHHRDSTSSARSHSRSELLLAYATEQGQVAVPPVQASMMVVPSQSAPTTPQVFPMPSYNLTHETTDSYPDPSGYFPASIPPSTSQLPDFTYQQTEPHFGGYFSVGRSASQSDAVGVSTLNPHETTYDPTQVQNIGHPGTSISGQGHDFPPVHGMLESTPSDLEITLSRPKPQCWEHGCNGRQFSTFSNLLRHQREKSGSAMKALCPYCGTEFTRTTARNGHMYGGKCKGRPDKEPSEEFLSASGKEK